MDYYRQSAQEVLRALGSRPSGLSGRMAAQKLKKEGPNKLAQPPGESLFQRFLRQMADPMILVLLAAAAISGLTAVCADESPVDVFIILTVVLTNALLGVFQESKAEKAIEALQKLTEAHSQVIRDGTVRTLPSDQLVTGDLVILETGSAIPADGRLVEAVMLKTEESALTGESLPCEKSTEPLRQQAALGDRHCMVYMGSTVSSGRGKMLVTATGMNTEMGRIAGVLASAGQGKTPLQQKLTQLGKTLSGLVLAICALIFGFTLWQAGSPDLAVVLRCFMIAVSLAVAAVPEGLAAVVTIVLSMGVTRMSKRGAVIRKLTAVETLGCAQVICSDKTGTLTQNRMTVRQTFGEKQELLRALVLCNDAQLLPGGKSRGEATEKALVEYGAKNGVLQNTLCAAMPRAAEIPFDSGRKRMSTFHRQRGMNGVVQYVKGAPDVLLARCSWVMQNGQKVPMTPAMRQKIQHQNSGMAERALRVLAAARREWSALPAKLDAETAERDLVFLGLAGLQDPVRPEAKEAIAECGRAGIVPVMITGDHKDTAAAIGRELGILRSGREVVTGEELEKLSDRQLQSRVSQIGVYARVQPQHKARIVHAWQARGCVVAMAGDGVNDAPAIKTADIGVGMGISGTDVTRNVADMVLADDNFATIVAAVGEGRRIYDNIRKAVQFLLASNLSEVLSVFFATLMGITLLKPAQLLWINLITDCFPALALGMERAQPSLMQRPPRPKSEGIFAQGLGFDVFWQGFLVTLLTMGSYFAGVYSETGRFLPIQSEAGAAMAFLTMSLAELFHSFNVRSRSQSLFELEGHNPWLWMAFLAGAALTFGVLLLPWAAAAFGFAELTSQQYVISTSLAMAIVPLVEVGKAFKRCKNTEKRR